MHERVKKEIVSIREKHTDLEHGDQLNWVLIPSYPLPRGRFIKDRTRLLFVIPPGYPNSGPDNFFVDGDLKPSTPRGRTRARSSSRPSLVRRLDSSWSTTTRQGV